MPTVIDEFVLSLGLDPSKFEEEIRDFKDTLSSAKGDVQKFGDEIEAHGKKITEVFGLTKSGIVGILAAFIGTEAARFVEQVAKMDAHTMQLAHSIGMSTRELSLWQNMVRGIGGDAAAAGATLSGLQDAFMGMRMGTQMPSGPFASLLARAGIDFRSATPGSALNGIMGFLQGQPETTQRFWLQQVPGMNESMMFLLMEIMRHPDKMRNLKEELEKIGLASDKSGEAALDLAQKTTRLEAAWESLARVLFPILSRILEVSARIMGGAVNLGNAISEGTLPTRGHWRDLLHLGPATTGMTAPSGAAPQSEKEHAAFILGAAASLGMDPNFALTVAGREGLHTWSRSATGQSFIPGEQSFGDFQLNYSGDPKRPSLGDIFTKQTGLDARDPSNWMAADRWALQWAKTHGWGDFHGARGLTPPAKGATVNIGSINVSSSKADPAAVAAAIPEAVRRYSMLAGINTGLT